MNKIRIGTRTSKLALVQAQIVAEALKQKFPDLNIEIVGIKTGEEKYKKYLSRKDIFVKEIEEALIKGDIDLAVEKKKKIFFLQNYFFIFFFFFFFKKKKKKILYFL